MGIFLFWRERGRAGARKHCFSLRRLTAFHELEQEDHLLFFSCSPSAPMPASPLPPRLRNLSVPTDPSWTQRPTCSRR